MKKEDFSLIGVNYLQFIKALFGNLERRGREVFGGRKFRGKYRNLSQFLKEYYFTES